MLNRVGKFFKLSAYAGLAASLSACAIMDETGLRGASSMTVDVEVYKGPLSKTREVQIAELLAIVRDAESTFWNIRRRNQLSLVENKCEKISEYYTSDTTVDLHKVELKSVVATAPPGTDGNGETNGTDNKSLNHNDPKPEDERRKNQDRLITDDIRDEIRESGSKYGPCLFFTILEYDSEELFSAIDQLSPISQRTPLPNHSGKNFQILEERNEGIIKVTEGALKAIEDVPTNNKEILQNTKVGLEATKDGIKATEIALKATEDALKEIENAPKATKFALKATEYALKVNGSALKTSNANYSVGEICIYDESNKSECLKQLYQIARVGGHLRARADFWGTISSTTAIDDLNARRRTADMAHYASEYGNQIISRADALIRLIEEGEGTNLNGIELAKLLSTSYYLRDSSTTNFLKLYDWNRAGSSGDAISGKLSRADRVRMVEMLINDNHWSNINSVYASGQGEVSMAFIKDDIGNWNLKSFENDPAKLLKAYDKFSFDLVQKAAELATGANGLDDALSILNLSQTAQSGSGLATNKLGIADIDLFRTDFKTKVSEERARVAEKLTNLQTDVSNSASLISESSLAKSIVARELQKDIDAADKELDKIKTSIREGCPEESLSRDADIPKKCTRISATAAPADLCINPEVDDPPMLAVQCELRKSAEAKANEVAGGSLVFGVEFICAKDIDDRTQLHASCAKYIGAVRAQKETRLQSVQNLRLMVSNYKAIIDAFQLSSSRR